MFTTNTDFLLPDPLNFARTQYRHAYLPPPFPDHVPYIQLEV